MYHILSSFPKCPQFYDDTHMLLIVASRLSNFYTLDCKIASAPSRKIRKNLDVIQVEHPIIAYLLLFPLKRKIEKCINTKMGKVAIY
jgi:hypothetical protein